MTDNTERINRVLALMSEGTSERKACEEAGISRSTFRTQALRAGVGVQYAEALFSLAMDQANKMEVVIDEMRNGVVEDDGTRGEKLDPAIGRLELDARKWFAAKFLPKQFGDKLALGGASDLPPISTVDVSKAPKDVLAWMAAQKVEGEL